MAAQKRERSKRELTCGENQARDNSRGSVGDSRSRKPREQQQQQRTGDDLKQRPDRLERDSVNSQRREKDYIVESTRSEPQTDYSQAKPDTPKLSRRSSLRYNPKFDNSSDIYTHFEEDTILEEDIKPEDDFNRTLLIAQSTRSSKRKTNSVRFKLDLDDVSDEGVADGGDRRKKKQYADSVISDTDQSLCSGRGIIRNLGYQSDRTAYRRNLDYVEMELGSKTWRGVDHGKPEVDTNDIDASRNDCDFYIKDDVAYPSAEERAKLQSASKIRRRLLQENRKSRGEKEPEVSALSGEESDWVSLPSLVFRDESDAAPPRNRRSTNSGRRRRRKRRSERTMEKPGIERILSNMSEEAKLAIDAILAEMEQEKHGGPPKNLANEAWDTSRRTQVRKKKILMEDLGKFASDDGVDSGFQDTDTSNNLNSRSSGSEEYQRLGISDRSRSKANSKEKDEDVHVLQKSQKDRYSYRSKTARSRTPTKFPVINPESDSFYAYDDAYTESSMPSRQNIPGLGSYRFPRRREKTFKITPPGYDSRYADVPRFEAPPGEEPDPTITAKAKEKCNQWLDQQYLPSLS